MENCTKQSLRMAPNSWVEDKWTKTQFKVGTFIALLWTQFYFLKLHGLAWMVTFIFYFNFVWTCGVGRGGFIMKWLLSCFCFLRARFDVDVAFFWFCDFCFHDWIFVARKIMWIKLIMNGSHHRNQVRHWYSFSICVVYPLPLDVNIFFGIDLSAEPVNDEFGQRQNKPRR